MIFVAAVVAVVAVVVVVAVVISYQLQEVRESTLYEVGGEPQEGVESTRRL